MNNESENSFYRLIINHIYQDEDNAFPTNKKSYGLGRNFPLGVAVGIFLGFVINPIILMLTSSKEPHNNLKKASFEAKCSTNLSTHQAPLKNKSIKSFDRISIPLNATQFSTKLTNYQIKVKDDIKIKKQEKGAINAFKNITVLCWILTNPGNHMWKAIHIKKTWGKRCTKLLFMSTKVEPKLPSIALPNVKEGRNWLWGKTKEALKYIYANHLHEADWFLKADDDTYVIMENLKHLLQDYDPNRAFLFGYKFITNWLSYIYMSGGAGYVMSKEALKRFVEKALFMNDTKCYTSYHDGMEDIEVSKCLLSVNTTFGNSRDKKGRERFNTNSAASNLGKYKNLESCSDSIITFHYTQPHEMYFMEYMIYHLKAYKPEDHDSFDSTTKTNKPGKFETKTKENVTPEIEKKTDKIKSKNIFKSSTSTQSSTSSKALQITTPFKDQTTINVIAH